MGYTGTIGRNAPYLKDINASPLPHVPSGKIIRRVTPDRVSLALAIILSVIDMGGGGAVSTSVPELPALALALPDDFRGGVFAASLSIHSAPTALKIVPTRGCNVTGRERKYGELFRV